MGKAAQVSYMFLLWYMQPGWKSLCLCPLDQCSALFRRLCSAGCQLPIGHRHHLPTQRRMREEDLHPSRIHADGCRLVETRAQPELYTLQRWRQINSQVFFQNFWFSENVSHNHTAEEPHLFRRGDVVHHQQRQKKKMKRQKNQLVAARQPEAARYLQGLNCGRKGTKRFRACCTRTITPL